MSHPELFMPDVWLYLPDSWIIRVALLGLLLLAVLAWLVSRSRLTRLREAGEYVIGETDRRVGLWLQLHPEEATEPRSLKREGLLGTRDLVVVVEGGGSKELDFLLIVLQVLVSVVIFGAALYVILSKQYQAADTNWAYGVVGTVIGFWLKGK